MDSLIYGICLVVGLLFAIVSAVAGHFFGGDGGGDVGTGGHAEAGFDDSGVPGISIFSPTVMAIFVTAFGGFGLIFAGFDATNRWWLSAPLAVVSGFMTAAAAFVVIGFMFKKTQSSSESRVATLIGYPASIMTPIPENGVGEIAYVQASTRYTAPARAEKGVAVAAGKTVRITRIVGTQFYVEETS
jgi:hypothetical protein